MQSFTMIYFTNDNHYVGGQKVIRRTHQNQKKIEFKPKPFKNGIT